MLRFLFPLRFRQWFGPLIVCGIVAGLIGVAVITSGFLNLTASTPHPAGWARMLHYVFRRSVTHHSRDLVVPADLDSPARVAFGATYYTQACAHCHGAPGLGQNPVALMMRPQPQFLPHELHLFDAKDLFWIVKHGVKYSAMPAWPAQSRDDEVWSMVGFLRRLPAMQYPEFRALAYNDADRGPTADPARDFGALPPPRTYDLFKPDQPAPPTYRYQTPAMGFDSFALIGDPVATCARCHGSDGAGRNAGAFPNLPLQDEAYLRAALNAFATGARKSAAMQLIATQLSPRQIDALAAYYAGQAPRRSETGTAPPAILAAGERIATAGVPVRKVGACINCHAIDKAVKIVFPRLSGQYSWYLAAQMKQFRAGGRGNTGSYNPMTPESHNLTDAEIDAVSAYYASLQPAARPPRTPTPAPPPAAP